MSHTIRFLLTSVGLPERHPNRRAKFLSLFTKPLSELQVAFIPTASRTPEERIFCTQSKEELVALGIPRENINTIELDRTAVTPDLLAEYDLVYVCGGNTFYLLHCAKESGFTAALPAFQGVYVGVSAGSILPGPSIEIARPWDENDSGITDPSGVGLVSFSASPHYVANEEDLVAGIEKTVTYKIVRLSDAQAIYSEGGDMCTVIEN